MSKGLKTYIKCVYVNKFAFVAFLTLFVEIFTVSWCLISGWPLTKIVVLHKIPTILSLSLLLATWGGSQTYLAYSEAAEHILKHSRLDARFSNTWGDWYCSVVGVRLAEKDWRAGKLGI